MSQAQASGSRARGAALPAAGADRRSSRPSSASSVRSPSAAGMRTADRQHGRARSTPAPDPAAPRSGRAARALASSSGRVDRRRSATRSPRGCGGCWRRSGSPPASGTAYMAVTTSRWLSDTITTRSPDRCATRRPASVTARIRWSSSAKLSRRPSVTSAVSSGRSAAASSTISWSSTGGSLADRRARRRARPLPRSARPRSCTVDVGVDAARVGHHVHGSAAERRGWTPVVARRSTAARHPARPTMQTASGASHEHSELQTVDAARGTPRR